LAGMVLGNIPLAFISFSLRLSVQEWVRVVALWKERERWVIEAFERREIRSGVGEHRERVYNALLKLFPSASKTQPAAFRADPNMMAGQCAFEGCEVHSRTASRPM
jgi:hypothetical protein